MLSNKKFKVGAWLLVILMIFNAIILSFTAAEGPEPLDSSSGEFLFDSLTTTVWIDSGEMFYIYFDPDDLELAARPPPNLPPECEQALDMVPEWLKGNLSYKFRELNNDFQVTYANLIINSPDPKYIDEIAFVIAHSAVQNLQDDYFFPELITHNAQLVYDNDQYLNYVDIVERSDYTTVVYRDKDNITMELERDIYYWYIVHPKLSDELATYVDPEYNYVYDAPHDRNYGTPPPEGKFWRDWLFYEADAGYPLLKDRLSEAWTVWEAISKCNGWMSDSMSFTSDEERPIQPVRIYRKHIGRCGEYQDMRNAIARAGLIPSTCTINSAEDHVWNEFWDNRWIHWDGATDNPMMYENGWGKKISSVWNTRGDGHIWSVIKKYTEVCFFTATVLDADGMPADGVRVDVATENYYNPDLLTTTTWGITDYTGTVTIPLGDERNYWASAESDTLGEDPLNGVTEVITDSVAGQNYTHTFNLPMSAEQLKITDNPPPGNPDEKYRMEIRYDVVANMAKSENSYTGEEGDMYGPSGDIDFFIADEINYNLYVGGLSFNAYNVEQKSTNGSVSFILPNENRYYVVLSNEFSQASCKIINITVEIKSKIDIEITGPADNSEFSLGDEVLIVGTSWGPEGVDTVELSLDDSQEWLPATATGGGFSTWEYNLDTTGLTLGLHKIWARATLGENSLSTSINITLNDVTDPALVIENPGENATYILGESLQINGTASDDVALHSLEIIVDSDEANSTDITHLLIDGYFSYDMSTYTLGYGDHTITIKATDTSQNFASVTRNIRIQEAVPPDVRIDTPKQGSIFKCGDIVSLSGKATDNIEILSLEIAFDNSEPIDIFEVLDEDGYWTYDWDTTSSVSGEHVVEVTAVDGSDNTDADDVTFFLDGSAPVAFIQVPNDNQIFKAGNTIIFEGTASDDLDLDSVHLVFDNGTPVDITSKVKDGEWSYNWESFDLDSGEHTISIRARDSVGRMVENAISIIIDAEDPKVEIFGIEDIIEIGERITIRGTASDDIEIEELTLVIDDDYNDPIDIIDVLDEDGFWTYDWDTKSSLSGEHTVEVTGVDSSDNTDSDDVTFLLDGSAPVAYIHVPNENQMFKAGNTIVLEGTASDDLDLDTVHLVFDNGAPVDITRKVKDGEWRYNWESFGLESGGHTISISAKDSVGHMTENEISIVIDAEDPDVEISGIDDVIEIGEWITIRGTAHDDIKIEELTLVIDDEETIDITSSLSYGDWMWDLDTSNMNEGIHIITVIARDGVDNEVEEYILIELAEEVSTSDDGPWDGAFDSDTQGDSDTSDAMDTEAFILLIILFILLGLVVVAVLSVRAVKKK